MYKVKLWLFKLSYSRSIFDNNHDEYAFIFTNYFKQFIKLNMCSDINKDSRINIECNLTEVYPLFYGNMSWIKKKITTDEL